MVGICARAVQGVVDPDAACPTRAEAPREKGSAALYVVLHW